MRNFHNLLTTNDIGMQILISSTISTTLCVLTSTYIKLIKMQNNELKISIMCLNCDCDLNESNVFNELEAKKIKNYAFYSVRKQRKNEHFVNMIYKIYMSNLQGDTPEIVKLNSISSLKRISTHVPNFYSNSFEFWLQFTGNENKEIRKAINGVIYYIFKNLLVRYSLFLIRF